MLRELHARLCHVPKRLVIIISSPGEVRSIVMCMLVGLSVGLYTRLSQQLHGRTSPIFIHVACGRSSVLLRRRCDT